MLPSLLERQSHLQDSQSPQPGASRRRHLHHQDDRPGTDGARLSPCDHRGCLPPDMLAWPDTRPGAGTWTLTFSGPPEEMLTPACRSICSRLNRPGFAAAFAFVVAGVSRASRERGAGGQAPVPHSAAGPALKGKPRPVEPRRDRARRRRDRRAATGLRLEEDRPPVGGRAGEVGWLAPRAELTSPSSPPVHS